jgi:hypothetical protein
MRPAVKTPRRSQNPKFCRGIHKNQPLNSVLKQMNSVHILKSYLFKIYFNIVLPTKLISSK